MCLSVFITRRFFLFILVLFFHVGYASFPISTSYNTIVDTIQNKEIREYHYGLKELGIDLASCKCTSCRAGLPPLVSVPTFKPSNRSEAENSIEDENKNEYNPALLYIILSGLTALGVMIFGLLTLGSMLDASGGGPNFPFLYLILMNLSLAATVFLSIQAKKRGASWTQALIGIGIILLSAFLFFMLVYV